MTCRVDAARYGSPIGMVCSAQLRARTRLTGMRLVLPPGTAGVVDFGPSATGRYAQPSRRVVTWTAHRPLVMRTGGRATFRLGGVILPRATNTLTASLLDGRSVVASGESRVRSRLAPAPSRRWRTAAAGALREYEAVRARYGASTLGHAYATAAFADLYGWRDRRTRRSLQGLLAQRSDKGGWGLGARWDAFGDGTVNPADTDYSITLSGHVGPVLLERVSLMALEARGSLRA